MNSIPPAVKKACPEWQFQISSALQDLGFQHEFVPGENFSLIRLQEFPLLLHLVNLKNSFNPEILLTLQTNYFQKGFKLVQIWEDLWLSKPDLVLERIRSICGLNTRIHGRKTKIVRIDQAIASSFLNNNHLQGYVNSRYKFGLYLEHELVAVCTFSALRKMNHSPNYHSAELIRFAVKAGSSVSGGLSKFIKYYAELLQPNDLMTYADRDWSTGAAYLKLNFKEVGQLPPQLFSLDPLYIRHLQKTERVVPDDQTVFNTGSLKYILNF